MSRSRRPRKAYRPKPVLKPLGIKDACIYVPGRVGQLALGTDWLTRDHLIDIGSHAMVAQRVARAVGDAEMESAADEIARIILEAENRRDRTGRVGTTGPEMLRLRALLDLTLPWLAEQPNIVIHRESTRPIRDFDRKVAEQGGIAA